MKPGALPRAPLSSASPPPAARGVNTSLLPLEIAASKWIICGSANAKDCKSCKSCKSAAYYEVKCQRADWPIHKLLCKVITAVPPRPSEGHILGIRFPEDSKNPQLVWVECKTIQLHGDENKIHDAQMEAHLGNDNSASGRMIIISNSFRGLEIDHTIILWYWDNCGYDGSKPNICAIETSGGKCSYNDKDLLVALHQIGLASSPYAFCKDVALEDLRIVVDGFKTCVGPSSESAGGVEGQWDSRHRAYDVCNYHSGGQV